MCNQVDYASVETAVGHHEINRHLASGWKIITAAFNDHTAPVLPSTTTPPNKEFVPYALMGLPVGVEPVSPAVSVLNTAPPLKQPEPPAQQPVQQPIASGRPPASHPEQAADRPPEAPASPAPVAPRAQPAVANAAPAPAASPQRRQSVQGNPLQEARPGAPERSEETLVGVRPR